MQKTAHQPAGSGWSPDSPPIVEDRPEQSYHEKKKRTVLDWSVFGVVVTIALIVIALSFHNTGKLANELNLNPYLAAGLVEVLFASLLFIRGRQRATQRNVPGFLTAGYFISLAFVTGVNMWGLSLENPVIGPVVGLAISGAMWLMESVLVWLWVDSHKPHEKSLRELKREAKKKRKEIKLTQQIEWMHWEAKKPDLALIQAARIADEKRKEVVRDGFPEFFKQAVTVADDVPVESDIQTVTVTGQIEEPNNQTAESDTNTMIGQEVEQDVGTVIEEKNLDERISQEKTEVVEVDKEEKPEDKKENTINFEDKKDEYKERVRKAAYELWDKENKRPGRSKIQKYTGCSQNISREIADELREEEKRRKQVS